MWYTRNMNNELGPALDRLLTNYAAENNTTVETAVKLATSILFFAIMKAEGEEGATAVWRKIVQAYNLEVK